VRGIRRYVAGLAVVLVLAAAAAGALALHARSTAGRPTSRQLELREEGQRLRDIRTILNGSNLAPNRATCAWYLRIDRSRQVPRHPIDYPTAGSADWNYLISVCADGGS
jgi:hypothetical protein